jgi:protein-disulfide isomerase
MKSRLGALVFASFLIAPSFARAETIVATVAGDPISMAELEKAVRPQLIEIENNRYDVLEQGLEGIISDKLLAKEAAARGVTVEQLRATEIEGKIQQPTDDDAKQLFEQNKAQLGNATFEDLKPRVVAYLVNQRSAARQTEFLDELKKKYATTISLEPPKIDVETAGRASRGGDANAPVTIIAFSDYECPFCKRAEVTVAQVMSAYPTQVRYVHRDFPLPFHQHAHEAAQAARCVGDQGKFWEYHDKLFQAQDMSTDNLKKMATDVGADPQKMQDCISAGKHEDEIQADIAAGSDVGVSGTPAFFINGRMLSGAQPFERFKELIDGELARRQAAAAAK